MNSKVLITLPPPRHCGQQRKRYSSDNSLYGLTQVLALHHHHTKYVDDDGSDAVIILSDSASKTFSSWLVLHCNPVIRTRSRNSDRIVYSNDFENENIHVMRHPSSPLSSELEEGYHFTIFTYSIKNNVPKKYSARWENEYATQPRSVYANYIKSFDRLSNSFDES